MPDPDAASIRDGSEFQPVEQRDFLRRTLREKTSGAGPPTSPGAAGAPGRSAPISAHGAEHAATMRRNDAAKLGVIVISRSSTFGSNKPLQRAFINQFQSQLDGELKLMDMSVPYRAFVRMEAERSTAAKAQYRRMDFPIYIVPSTQGIADIHSVMRAHRIPARLGDIDVYDLTRRGWEDVVTPAYGVAAPPTPGAGAFGKAAFVSFDRVSSKCFGSLSNCLANVALHELFHLFGFTQHSHSGLMRRSDPSDAAVPLDAQSRRGISGKLNVLYLAAMKP